ncbi:MAG: hypothetical protein HOO96_38605, partial [Polyangiaceae bacterium]|nr:hypothetical protein [Polyangiaceae bacterium]
MVRDVTEREAVIAEWLRPQSKGIAAPIAELTCIGTRTGPDKRTNEDRVIYARIPDDRGSAADAFIVCDGIGGLDQAAD